MAPVRLSVTGHLRIPAGELQLRQGATRSVTRLFTHGRERSHRSGAERARYRSRPDRADADRRPVRRHAARNRCGSVVVRRAVPAWRHRRGSARCLACGKACESGTLRIARQRLTDDLGSISGARDPDPACLPHALGAGSLVLHAVLPADRCGQRTDEPRAHAPTPRTLWP